MVNDPAPRVRLRVTGRSDAPGAPNAARAPVVEVGLRGAEIRLGRRAGSDVELPFASVSGAHARLLPRDGQWLLEDLGSANGTWVNGTRLAPGAPQLLAAGTGFRIADVGLVFEGAVRSHERPADEPVHGTETIARRLVADLFAGLPSRQPARLTVIDGPDQGRSLDIAEPGRRYRVGRARSCDLVLADPDASREQVEIERRWEGLMVRDPGSKNGVALDGARIEGERLVADGQILGIGATRIRIEDPESRYLDEVRRESDPAPVIPSGGPEAPPPEAPPAPVDNPKGRRAFLGPRIIVVVALLALGAAVALVGLLFGSSI